MLEQIGEETLDEILAATFTDFLWEAFLAYGIMRLRR
jgi:hypothetical protein